MAVFNKCSNCGTSTIGGRRDGDHVFCSKECQSWFYAPGFCEACAQATNQKSLGGTFTLNLIGTKLYGLACKHKECPVCHSVPQRMWFVALLIPIFPVSREYLVKYPSPGRYVSRQVNPLATAAAAAATVAAPAATAVAVGGRKCPKCGTVFADAKTCPVCAGTSI